MHGAGVGRLPYRALTEALPPGWRVTVSEDDGTGEATIEALAERYLAPLLAANQLPDVLGGWSMGGLLAHAMAVGLQDRGHRPPPLLLLDSPVPGDAVGEAPGSFEIFARDVLRAADPAVRLPDRLRLGHPGRPGDRGARRAAAPPREARSDVLHARYALHARHVAAMATHDRAGVIDTPGLLVAADLDAKDVQRWQR